MLSFIVENFVKHDELFLFWNLMLLGLHNFINLFHM